MDITAGYHGGDEFSTEAHKSILVSKERIQAQVLAHIESQGSHGATSDETELALGMSHQTCGARFTELKALGKIRPTGDKRKTRYGRNAGVWWVPQKPKQESFI